MLSEIGELVRYSRALSGILMPDPDESLYKDHLRQRVKNPPVKGHQKRACKSSL